MVPKVPYLRPGVLDAQNVVTIPLAKLLRKLGRLPDDQFHAVKAALRNWLGLKVRGIGQEEK